MDEMELIDNAKIEFTPPVVVISFRCISSYIGIRHKFRKRKIFSGMEFVLHMFTFGFSLLFYFCCLFISIQHHFSVIYNN